jgi:hypothetical protein
MERGTLDLLINGARFAARASGVTTDFPPQVTETERWEWPLTARENGGQWFPFADGGRSLFDATPPAPPAGVFRTCMQRVVVCSTRAQLAELFPCDEVGAEIEAVTTIYGIGSPTYTRVYDIGGFWPALFGTRWYLDAPCSSLPGLLVTTGDMRCFPPEGGESPRVESRLREVADHFGIRFETVSV